MLDFSKIVSFRTYLDNIGCYGCQLIKQLDIYLSVSRFGEPVKLTFSVEDYEGIYSSEKVNTNYIGKEILSDLIEYFSEPAKPHDKTA